jgi:hypothetical protein
MANWKSHLWSSGVAKPHEAPGLSQFERTVERLGLKEYEWASSVKLEPGSIRTRTKGTFLCGSW